MNKAKNPIILFLGNEIMGDDRLGLELGRSLSQDLKELGCDVELLETTGLSLIEYLSGRPLAILVDSIATRSFEPGTVTIFTPDEFKAMKCFSPHYAGIPEALELMRVLDLDPPKRVYVIGIEVLNPFEPSFEMTPQIRERLDKIRNEVFEKLRKIISSRG